MRAPSSPEGIAIEWRPAVAADAAALSDVFNRIADADDTPERLSADTMEHELTSMFAPLEERTVVGRIEDEVVCYGTVYHRPAETDEARIYVAAYVSPTLQGRGLEDAIVDWSTAVASDVLDAVEVPSKYICAWLYKQQRDEADRFARRGFEAVRHWWEMERPLDDDLPVELPEGIDVVGWDDTHSEPVRLVENAAFADHWGSAPMSETDWQTRMLDSPGFRRDLSFVAAAGDEVVGFSYNEVYEEDWEAAGRSEGWISGLGVLREWRKRGIATALLSASMNAMRKDGLEAAMIGVDSSSPSGAQHLYRSVGFSTKSTGTTWQLALD